MHCPYFLKFYLRELNCIVVKDRSQSQLTFRSVDAEICSKFKILLGFQYQEIQD